MARLDMFVLQAQIPEPLTRPYTLPPQSRIILPHFNTSTSVYSLKEIKDYLTSTVPNVRPNGDEWPAAIFAAMRQTPNQTPLCMLDWTLPVYKYIQSCHDGVIQNSQLDEFVKTYMEYRKDGIPFASLKNQYPLLIENVVQFASIEDISANFRLYMPEKSEDEKVQFEMAAANRELCNAPSGTWLMRRSSLNRQVEIAVEAERARRDELLDAVGVRFYALTKRRSSSYEHTRFVFVAGYGWSSGSSLVTFENNGVAIADEMVFVPRFIDFLEEVLLSQTNTRIEEFRNAYIHDD